MTRTVFTICSANYLATAKVLMDSLHRHEAGSRRVLVLAERDWSPGRLAALGELLHCEILPLGALDLPGLERMAFQYDITEFNTAVKPFVFRHLFGQGDEAVIYLDPDIKLYQPLDALWKELEQHDAIVTPHITEPLPDDGLAPSTENMLRCGQYNFGFVGLVRRERPLRFIDWWAERLTDHCIFHPQHFYFVDQFYGALLSSVVPATRVWPHQGYNYAYWNAMQRQLDRRPDGGWATPDGDLVFFHFSGFVHDDPAALSRHQNRVRAEPGSALETIAIEYGREVAANNEPVADYADAYSFGQYHDGSAIDTIERRAYRDLPNSEKAAFGDPFDPATRERLGTYAEIDAANGSAAGLLWELWEQRKRGERALADAAESAAVQKHELLGRISELDGVVSGQKAEIARLHSVEGDLRHVNEELARSREDLQREQRKFQEADQYIQSVHGSASFKAGRLLTLPLRAGKRYGAAALRGGRSVSRHFNDYRRQHGAAAAFGASLRFLKREGLGGVLRHARPGPDMEMPANAGTAAVRARQPLPLTPHTENVDVIVCIHNALDDVRNCLAAVLRNTAPPYRLILVDDGSQPDTRDYVQEFAQSQGLTLIRNEEARGYTLAANQGMRASTGEFVVLLNSDTIVSPGWLERMLRCFRSDPAIGVAGPLSNTASWQSVPEIFDENGDWYDNPLPEGISVDDMAAQVAEMSVCQYPRVGFLNGFCYMIRRAALDEVGLFDEETFGRGFGEENDFSLRAAKAGWQLAVVDDAYVFHAQSRSYSSERRLKLAKLADESLSRKHGDPYIWEQVKRTRYSLALAAMRARMARCWPRRDLMAEALARHEGRRVLFLLPVTSAGGGGNVIIHEARAMAHMGVDARIVNLSRHKHWFEHHHPHLGLPVDYIDDPQDLDALLENADAVVATLYLTVEWIAGSLKRTGNTRVAAGYYIQDFEPHFFPEDNPEHQRAWNSYSLLPGLKRITKTEWNRQEVLKHCKVDSAVVGCSYDTRLFTPIRQKREGAPVRVIAMVRPSTPRRAPALTLKVLKTLHERLGDKVELRYFGVPANDARLARMDTDFPHVNLGELSPEGVADALDDADIFLDLSTYQAMGLTALEAMACGVAVVAPLKGGSGEIVHHEDNGLLVDTSDEQACIDAALRLASDHALRQRIQEAALASAPSHAPERAAARALDALFGHEAREAPSPEQPGPAEASSAAAPEGQAENAGQRAGAPD